MLFNKDGTTSLYLYYIIGIRKFIGNLPVYLYFNFYMKIYRLPAPEKIEKFIIPNPRQGIMKAQI